MAGTYTDHPYSLITNRTAKVTILPNGNVGIGTPDPDTKLSVNGNIRAQGLKVEMTGWPDHVFNPSYHLPSLKSVKNYIAEYGHLLEVPSEKEVIKNGIDVGQMNKILLKKIEELTLYVLQKDDQILQQNMRLKKFESRLDQLNRKFKKRSALR